MMDPECLKSALRTVLDERDVLDQRTHHEHHGFVAAQIARQRLRAEQWERVRGQVGISLLISLLGIFGLALWEGFKALLRKGGH